MAMAGFVGSIHDRVKTIFSPKMSEHLFLGLSQQQPALEHMQLM